MLNVVAVNGSPHKDKGSTALVLSAFLEGLQSAGAEAKLIYTADLDLKPCTGEMYCWYKHLGKCYLKDDMQAIYPRLKQADTLIIATPVYIPLPGKMQIFINRLCPLIYPLLETRSERTRARFHDDVHIQRLMLVSTGGWWEKENFDTVIRIVEELAETSSTGFSGALIRPHAFLMKQKGELTEDGKQILDLVRKLGSEYAADAVLDPAKLAQISRPLFSRETLLQRYNNALK